MAITLIAGAGGGGEVLRFGLDRGYRVTGYVPEGRLLGVPGRFVPHVKGLAGGLRDCVRRHVEVADAVLILGRDGRATAARMALCHELHTPALLLDPDDLDTPEAARAWLARSPALERLHVVAEHPGERRRPIARTLERALWARSVTIAVAAVSAGSGYLALARLQFVDREGTCHARAVHEILRGTAADAEARAASLGLAELKAPSAAWIICRSAAAAYGAPSARHRVRWARPFDEASADCLRSAHELATALSHAS